MQSFNSRRDHSVLKLALVAMLALLLAPAAVRVSLAADDAQDPKNAPALEAKTPDDFVAHESEDKSASIRTPKDWKDGKLSGNTKVNLLIDEAGSSFNLVIVANPPEATLELIRSAVPAMMKQMIPTFEVKKSDYVKLNGEPAVRFISDATVQGNALKFYQMLVLKNGKQFVLTYTAKAAEFEKHVKEIEQAAVSLTIK